MFSCEFYEISKNTLFYRTPLDETASIYQNFLRKSKKESNEMLIETKDSSVQMSSFFLFFNILIVDINIYKNVNSAA